MVLWKNIFSHIPDHVVQVDLPSFADRPAAQPGMEIPVANKYGQSLIGDIDGDNGMAFLNSQQLAFSRKLQA